MHQPQGSKPVHPKDGSGPTQTFCGLDQTHLVRSDGRNQHRITPVWYSTPHAATFSTSTRSLLSPVYLARGDKPPLVDPFPVLRKFVVSAKSGLCLYVAPPKTSHLTLGWVLKMLNRRESIPPQEYLFCVAILSIQRSAFLFYFVVIWRSPTHMCNMPK